MRTRVVLVRGPAMIEAAKTTATAGEIWVICVVMVVCLAFWLSMVAWADRHPVWRGRHMPEMPGPVLGGMHVAEGGRSVAPTRDAPPVLTIEESEEFEQGEGVAPAPERPRVPGQRSAGAPPAPTGGGQAGAVPGMPTPRSGDADRPERSVAGPGGAERGDGESGRRRGLGTQRGRVTRGRGGSLGRPEFRGGRPGCRRLLRRPWRA